MIARLWRGWTPAKNAQPYEQLLKTTILPGIHRVDGYRGALLLKRDHKDSVEFLTMTLFADLQAIRAFSGEDYEVAVVPAQARELLERFDERSQHYQLAFADADLGLP